MSEQISEHFPALDANHKVFVLSPLGPTTTKDVIRCHLSHFFHIKRFASLGFLFVEDDVHRMQGIEKLHVLELMPRRLVRAPYEEEAYRILRHRAAERFELMSGRHEAFCNLWIKVNLP